MEIQNLTADDLFQERLRIFQEFLDLDYGANLYKDAIRKMINLDAHRLIVNINHLRSYNREYADGILKEPMEYLPPFDQALKDVVLSLDHPLLKGRDVARIPYAIGLEGSFGANQCSPRDLSAKHLGKLVCVQGIVTKCSLVRPKVVESVHFCEATQVFHSREYRDGTNIANSVPTSAVYPKEDENGNPLTTQFGLSTYRDHQTLSIQEMPERAPAGQLPRPIDVIVDDDLVDRAKPGDRVEIVGVFRSIGKHAASVSALFKTVLIVNAVRNLGQDVSAPLISDVDVQEIKKIGRRADVFDLLSTSLAPSIYGHEYIKKAILLLMLGGLEKNLENGTHLRGDINILLIGDPSTAKSQMLRFVLSTAPLAIATTGRGSSGVGLTAAVSQDRETGERVLEAGAMVLADRGIVCIDEFDKMTDIDRVAIHEVMEQQTVTIAKAGIHTSLNARCSVLAAANPAFGQYLDEKKPFENITLPDSLLSRFDLVFIVLDKTDDEFNRRIAEHITRLHRYTPPDHVAGSPVDNNQQVTELEDPSIIEKTPVFQKFNALLHIGVKQRHPRSKNPTVELLSYPFLKKYLYYCKTRIRPTLQQEASDFISTAYSELRAKQDGVNESYRTMPITPRTLETLIRLATAHAKSRLSQVVTIEDARLAYEILVFALFKEVKKQRVKRVKVPLEGEDGDSTMFSDTTHVDEATAQIAPAVEATDAAPMMIEESQPGDDSNTFTQVSLGGAMDQDTPAHPDEAEDEKLNDQEMERFRELLFPIRQAALSGEPNVPLVEIYSQMPEFTPAQILYGLQVLTDANQGVWLRPEEDDVLFI